MSTFLLLIGGSILLLILSASWTWRRSALRWTVIESAPAASASAAAVTTEGSALGEPSIVA